MAGSDLTLINPESTEWTEEETKTTLAVLAKMANCQRATGRLPLSVFEAFTAAKLNVAFEIVCFDAEGRVLLGRRPSKKENPDEPYPGLWHSFGVTLRSFEAPEEAMKRFVATEATLAKLEFVGWAWSVNPPRGPYIQLIFWAEVEEEPQTGELFKEEDIPWDELVPSHREILLPKALAAWKARKG